MGSHVVCEHGREIDAHCEDCNSVGVCETMAYLRIERLLADAEREYDAAAIKDKDVRWARVRALRDAQALFATPIDNDQT